MKITNNQQKPYRVAFVTVTPSPYAMDVFAALHQASKIEFHVFFLEDEAPAFPWEKQEMPNYAEILPGKWFWFLGTRVHINKCLFRKLKTMNPDLVVVGGYLGITQQLLMHWLHFKRIPWIFWGELPGMSKGGALYSFLRWIAQRAAVRWPQGIAAIGSRAAEVYRRMTPPKCIIKNIPYYCELSPFQEHAKKRVSSYLKRVRFLYCGQLIERKGVDLLLETFLFVAREFESAHLMFIGEGPLRTKMQAEVPPELKDRIVFTGFKQIKELPEYFSQGDVFVIPSRHDGWGVVLNQALGAGLPIIATNAVGASVDLIEEKKNGFIIKAGNVEELASAMKMFLIEPELVGIYGKCSQKIADKWTPAHGAKRWDYLINQVMSLNKT